MTTPFRCDGIDYSPEGITSLREEIISYRDGALKQNAFEVAVVLTHVVAILAYLLEVMNQVNALKAKVGGIQEVNNLWDES